MKKKNVYLVDLASGSNMNLLPLAICMVGSYSLDQTEIRANFNIDYRFLRQSGKELAKSMDNPAIVGFSCYVWNLRGSLSAAKEIKRYFPNSLIVLGGYSIPKIPDRIKEFFRLHPYVDILIHGEGELTFANFLRANMNNHQYSEVAGLTHKNPDVRAGFTSNPDAVRIDDLDTIPSPFLNGTFDEMMSRYGSKITGALWETNRGCPYACTFCDWGDSAVNKIKKYGLDRLREEIEWISRNEFYYMFLSDANFGIFKERDLELAGYIADCHTKSGFPHHVVTNWAKNKGEGVIRIAERLAKGGIASNITMAIQSTNPETLKVIKRKNLAQGKIDHLKSMFHDKYMPTYVEVILGLPLETYETFTLGLNTILSNRLEDRFYVYLCQILENTELDSPESRAEYQLETRHCRHTVSNRKFEWSDKDVEYEEFVISTSTMSQDDWVRSYVVGYFLTVLYNHRSAFFPFVYFREEHGILPVELTEFIISVVQGQPEVYPVLNKSIGHIIGQAQLVIDGENSMSNLPEAEGLVVVPHVGALVLLTKDKEYFYEELGCILRSFIHMRQLQVNELAFEEILVYQKLRFPSWPQKDVVEHTFNTTVALYFESLTSGGQALEIEEEQLHVIFKDHRRKSDSFAEFAASMVRGGLTVDLLEEEIKNRGSASGGQDNLSIIRREMEQRGLNKLNSEYKKVASASS